MASAAGSSSSSPRAAPRPEEWKRWKSWGELEAGSLAFRSEIHATWGGLRVLGQHELPIVALAYQGHSTFAVVRKALGDLVDDQRPTRLVTTRSKNGAAGWAMLFGATVKTASLPAFCQDDLSAPYEERTGPNPGCATCSILARGTDHAILCGEGKPLQALRDDYAARGLAAGAPAALHAEAHDSWSGAPPRALLDAKLDHGKLVATLTLTPRASQPERRTTPVTSAELSAARRVQAAKSVEIGLPQSVAGDLQTTLFFKGFSVAPPVMAQQRAPGPTTRRAPPHGSSRMVFTAADLQFVVASPEDAVQATTAYWKTLGKSSHVALGTCAAPGGLPKGTRCIHVHEWTRVTSVVNGCPPGVARHGPIGHCIVKRLKHPYTQTVTNDSTLFVPDGGGTWVTTVGGPVGIAALGAFFKRVPSKPGVWKLPMLGLGKLTTKKASIFWARHALVNGDEEVDIRGTITPPRK